MESVKRCEYFDSNVAITAIRIKVSSSLSVLYSYNPIICPIRECGSIHYEGLMGIVWMLIQKSMGMVLPFYDFFLKVETGMGSAMNKQTNMENPLHLSSPRSITL